jgi:hypothetical protein
MSSSIFVRSVDPVGEADIVATGPGDSLQYYFATPGAGWTNTQVAGPGTTFSAPSIVVRDSDPVGEADIVALGPDNSLMYYFATPGSGWAVAECEAVFPEQLLRAGIISRQGASFPAQDIRQARCRFQFGLEWPGAGSRVLAA